MFHAQELLLDLGNLKRLLRQRFLANRTARKVIQLISRTHPELRYVYVDVGARGGFSSKKNTRQLARLKFSDFFSIAIEPDPYECERLRLSGDYDVVVPAALWDRIETGPLYITQLEGLSSMFLPNAAVLATSGRSEAYNVTETIQVDCVQLSSVAGDHDVDVVKMNVQGSSHEILIGAGRVLEGAIAIQLDLFFDEIYEGQRLFQESHDFLVARGFRMARLSCPNDNGFVGQGIFTYYKIPKVLCQEKLLKSIAISTALEDLPYARNAWAEHEARYPNRSPLGKVGKILDT